MRNTVWTRRRTGTATIAWVLIWFGIVAVIGGLIVGWLALTTWILMLAWNFVMPTIFGLPELTFWQAFAFSVIVNLLSAGFRATVSTRSRD